MSTIGLIDFKNASAAAALQPVFAIRKAHVQ
jgi:hypothetical protein